MSTLQNFSHSRLMAGRTFAVSNRKRAKIGPLRQTANQENPTALADEDHNLVRRVLSGDLPAQSQLFAGHTPRLYRVAFNVLRNKEDAEDAVQDGWCRAFSKLHTFQGRSSLSTWLTRIVINSALMIRRRNKHQLLTSLDELSDDAVRHYLVDGRRTPEEVCGDEEMNELLVRQIRQLPSATRTAFLLREMDELTTSESIERLDVKRSALKSRVLRARRRIARNMRQLLQEDRRRKRAFTTAGRRIANLSSIAT